MIYFISGHRNLSKEEFELYYEPVIDNTAVNDPDPEFVVGDCDGVDKFAMDYIYNNLRCPLTIYHMFNSPRNTPEGMEMEDAEVDDVYFVGGFTSDEERDSAMTRDSDFDIAFIKDNRWNSGTAQNIKRRHGLQYGI